MRRPPGRRTGGRSRLRSRLRRTRVRGSVSSVSGSSRFGRYWNPRSPHAMRWTLAAPGVGEVEVRVERLRRLPVDRCLELEERNVDAASRTRSAAPEPRSSASPPPSPSTSCRGRSDRRCSRTGSRERSGHRRRRRPACRRRARRSPGPPTRAPGCRSPGSGREGGDGAGDDRAGGDAADRDPAAVDPVGPRVGAQVADRGLGVVAALDRRVDGTAARTKAIRRTASARAAGSRSRR